ncbi:MAG: hypothetical protein Q6373_008705 [Candidatus Sigynarchaeota archaeon]
MDNGTPADAWAVFDLVKINLTDILVKGVESGGIASHLPALATLKGRLATMNMGTVADLVQGLMNALQDTAGASTSERRARVSGAMMKIMAAARLFEIQLNVETVKQQLAEPGGD